MHAARPIRPSRPQGGPDLGTDADRAGRVRSFPFVRGTAIVGAGLLVGSTVASALPAGPAVAAVAATAGVAASAAPASAVPTAAAASITQPKVREVALSGINRSVLAKAPEPHDHEEGTVSASSVRVTLKAAVAATIPVKDPAELVAVAADKAFPAGSVIQVRVREKGRWSAWTHLHVDPEHGPDPGTGEARTARPGSEPLMAVNATRVQVRIDTPTGKVPRGTELTLVNAPSAASDSVVGRVSASRMTTMATVGQPPIITRSQWGANESWRSRTPSYTSNIRAAFVHHTASTNKYSASQAAAQVRAIYAYHTRSLRHSDIDYNFLVDRFGRLYEGRHGGIDRPVLGAHTAGFNSNTFAVSALGNFQTFSPSATDMAAIKDSIARLVAWKLGMYGVNPSATVKLVSAGYIKATRYPKGRVATISATSSHQTTSFTACPGKYLQAQMPAIRQLAAQYSDVVISSPSPPSDTFVQGSRSSVTLTSHTTRAVSWTADILSPCSDTPVRTFTGMTAEAGPIEVTWDLADAGGAPVLPAAYTVRISGSATDGTPVATVTNTVTITPAPGGAWGPCANASRVVGSTAAATSVLWGRMSAPSGQAVVLTGPATAGASALAAGAAAAPLARVLGAPLLVTSAGSLAAEVAADIQARSATEVIVVGGPGVVSEAVVGAVSALGVAVTRLSGPTDAATAAAVAARMAAPAPGSASSAVLVSPDGAHAIAGAALAAARGVPVLLAAASAVPAETRAALAGRTSVTVAAPAALSDGALGAALTGLAWDRITGADAVGAALAAAGAFPTQGESIVLLPDVAATWATAPATAALGVPVLFTTNPTPPPGVVDFLRARTGLRGVITSVGASSLDDQVLGAASRLLLGLPWAPPGSGAGAETQVVVQAPPPTATSSRKVGRANAAPEPVRKGRSLKVTAKVRAKYSDGSWRAVPAGVRFTVQFKASGAKKYRAVATGTTTSGVASRSVKATKSGRWRIVVGSKASASDYVRVRK